jgi:cobalt-zinc-cadmium efflux system outer membrane protein
MKMRSILPAVVVFVSGCSAPKASLDHVQATVAERTGKRVHWNSGGADDAQIKQGVQTSLGRELTAESAVQIALLNNHDLQARFEEIGISQAD